MKKLFVALLALFLIPMSVGANMTIIPTDDIANVNMDIPPVASESGTLYHLRTINSIVIHHSGSFPYGYYSNADMWSGYKNHHMYSVHPGIYELTETWGDMPAQQNFPDGVSYPDGYNINSIDYHFGVGTDGLIYTGRPEGTVGWHASNWEINIHSLGVCFIGNFDLVEPSETQYWAGVDLVSKLMLNYRIYDLYRHSDFAAKSCPGYAFPWYQFVRDCKQWAGIYNDFGYDHWAHDAVADLGQKNILTGFPDGNLYPDYFMTRAEFVVLVAKSLHLTPIYGPTIFTDVYQYDWFAQYLNALTAKEIINGYADGTFKPDKQITRAEASAVLCKALSLPPVFGYVFSDVQTDHWAFSYIYTLYEKDIIDGYPDHTFRPDNLLRRSEGFTLVDKTLNQ